MNDPLAEGLNELTAALAALGIRFFVSGSLASCAHGIVRATMDGDLVALLFPPHARQLSKALGAGWYADAAAMEQAIRDRRAFNLIHMASAMKFDVFPALTEFHDSELERAILKPLNDIIGILALNPKLDRQYVGSWAARLRVTDLLERAIANAQRP